MWHFREGVAAGLAGADSFGMGLKVVVVYLPLYRWTHYVIAELDDLPPIKESSYNVSKLGQ